MNNAYLEFHVTRMRDYAACCEDCGGRGTEGNPLVEVVRRTNPADAKRALAIHLHCFIEAAKLADPKHQN